MQRRGRRSTSAPWKDPGKRCRRGWRLSSKKRLHLFFYSLNGRAIAATAAALRATTAGTCYSAASASSTALHATTAAAASFQQRRCRNTALIRSSSIFSVSGCAAVSSTMQRVDSAVSVAAFSMRQRQRGFGLSFFQLLAAATFSSEPACQYQYQTSAARPAARLQLSARAPAAAFSNTLAAPILQQQQRCSSIDAYAASVFSDRNCSCSGSSSISARHQQQLASTTAQQLVSAVQQLCSGNIFFDICGICNISNFCSILMSSVVSSCSS